MLQMKRTCMQVGKHPYSQRNLRQGNASPHLHKAVVLPLLRSYDAQGKTVASGGRVPDRRACSCTSGVLRVWDLDVGA